MARRPIQALEENIPRHRRRAILPLPLDSYSAKMGAAFARRHIIIGKVQPQSTA